MMATVKGGRKVNREPDGEFAPDDPRLINRARSKQAHLQSQSRWELKLHLDAEIGTDYN